MKFIISATTVLFLLTSAHASPIPPDAQSDIMAFLEGLETVGSSVDEISGGRISSYGFEITTGDLEGDIKYGISWWQVFGELLVAKAFLDELDQGNYDEAAEIAGSYIAKEVIGKTAAGSAVLGATRIAGIGTLAVDAYLNAYADMMDRGGIRRQMQLYLLARELMSHDEIMAGEDAKGVYFDNQGFIDLVEGQRTVGFSPRTLSEIDRDLLLEFLGAAYDANVLKKRLNRETKDLYQDFLESVVARRLSESQSDPESDDSAESERGSLGGAAPGTSSQAFEPKLSPKTHPQRWGPEIVSDLGDEWLGGCSSENIDTECLREKGVSEGGIAFIEALREQSPYPLISIHTFHEFGRVDLAVGENISNSPRSSFLLNGNPDILWVLALSPEDSYRDGVAQRAFSRSKDPNSYAEEVVGHRILPNGNQRFVVNDYVVDYCKACSLLGHGLHYIEFDTNGTKISDRPIALFASEQYPLPDNDVGNLQRNPALLQYRLTKLGYELGPIDGAIGNKTQAAILTFQKEHCLLQTGTADSATLMLLASAGMERAPCAGTPDRIQTADIGTLIGRFGSRDSVMDCMDGSLTVRTGRIDFYESDCFLDDPIPMNFELHATMATCLGEGSEWREHISLQQKPGDIISVMSPDGAVGDYYRCPN